MEEETPQSAAWVEVWRREVFTTATDAARAAVLQQAALAALKQPKRSGAPARDTPSKAAAEAARAAATPVTSDTFLMVAAEKWLAHPQNVFPGVVATAVAPVDPADARGEAGVRETVCAYVARGAAEGYETLRAAARRLTVDAHVMGRVYEGCAEGFVHDVVLVQRARAAPPSTDEDPLDSSARHRVVYVPNLAPVAAEVANTELLATAPRRMYLPKWYPKAQAFAFVFDRAASALSMSAIPLPDDSSEESLKKIGFIGEKLLKKLESWAKAGRTYVKHATYDQVVPREMYVRVVKRIKRKYNTEWLEKWKTRTDTTKHVYEDINTAAYLLALFEMERTQTGITQDKQTFVDLGCGNGLLVDILTQEGYSGFGIDLNPRHVWSYYAPNVKLLAIKDFSPVNAAFPGTHWFIGSHADELTPWVPLIAARSGYDTAFFNVPCCFWDFDKRFKECDLKVGKYKTYLAWLKGPVSRDLCGFTGVQEDVLRIPSTKNYALVAMPGRSYPEADWQSIGIGRIDAFIESSKISFVPREVKE